jgi:cobyrinic acid a,c-diamide synthase
MAGVIANRIAGAGHAKMVAEAVRDVPLLGTLPRQQQSLPERHLGLVQPDEVEQIDAVLDRLAEQLELDADAWNQLPHIPLDHCVMPAPTAAHLQGKTIAVARDAAFAFLYPANLDCLKAMGAAIQFFSPLADEAVPEMADAVYLPGGYPEMHAQALSQAACWQASMRFAYTQNKPILAECGGMMALAGSLTDLEGKAWPMVGLLPGDVKMQNRLAALGMQGWATLQGELRGHAFHYSKFETVVVPHAHAVERLTGGPGEAIYRQGTLTASYFHAYFPSCPEAVASLFLQEPKEHQP